MSLGNSLIKVYKPKTQISNKKIQDLVNLKLEEANKRSRENRISKKADIDQEQGSIIKTDYKGATSKIETDTKRKTLL